MALLRQTTLILAVTFLLGAAAAVETELLRGFTATPSRSDSVFQPILRDPTGNFSMGFLRINGSGLALAVVHVASSEPLWSADLADPARLSDRTELSFNGSLVISDPSTGVLWSTRTDGDRVVLLNSSDLQMQKTDPPAVLWQSFHFPTNTIVQNQNFTSNMSLVSSNGLYTMSLGDNFIGLYANFERGKEQMYWKHGALEARATIVEGAGPIYAQVNSDGYLAMYQNSSTAVDIETFSSFQKAVDSFVLVRLEPDGNLKGYYWNGSEWVMDYRAISDFCELPSPCGSYGLCARDNDSCTCLDNHTEPHSGGCGYGSGDLCEARTYNVHFRVLRRSGVELPYKELMGYQTVSSLEQCESICESNCRCWGAVYNNASGSCYVLDYPVQTLMSVDDETKLGYFKVISETGHRGKGYRIGFGVGVSMWVMLGLVVVGAIFGFGYYRRWRRRRGVSAYLEEANKVSPGPYKDLGSASFRSIEMSSG
ncbi:PAN domain-containing protein At5g03700 [Punica granatum]|uniref:Apple domain-containing protein n=2 Tax=Punica granatum TaxID=22663 RepID=A0A218XDE2_PUNGR|nr:PAN domain-containing protein At5g03700 [Punica granatum]OWM82501.1 hypothetical protein CDL15_Pgr002076 [Punica granatum]PKI35994.1 hypothetical protein CRG98_043623 [Punica granatum]